MKVVTTYLEPLRSKHYDTGIDVEIEKDGSVYDLRISISGYYPKPSKRELEKGWDPEFGMDHVENEAELFLAEKIVEALSK